MSALPIFKDSDSNCTNSTSVGTPGRCLLPSCWQRACCVSCFSEASVLSPFLSFLPCSHPCSGAGGEDAVPSDDSFLYLSTSTVALGDWCGFCLHPESPSSASTLMLLRRFCKPWLWMSFSSQSPSYKLTFETDHFLSPTFTLASPLCFVCCRLALFT